MQMMRMNAMKQTIRMNTSLIFAVLMGGCASGNITTRPSTPPVECATAPAKYAIQPEMELLRFGEVKPSGWLSEQMRRDLESGFAGHMPEIAPSTAKSDIRPDASSPLNHRRLAPKAGGTVKPKATGEAAIP
jgi:hypothetical protein